MKEEYKPIKRTMQVPYKENLEIRSFHFPIKHMFLVLSSILSSIDHKSVTLALIPKQTILNGCYALSLYYVLTP